jgi:hypothetical protein
LDLGFLDDKDTGIEDLLKEGGVTCVETGDTVCLWGGLGQLSRNKVKIVRMNFFGLFPQCVTMIGPEGFTITFKLT